MFQCLKHSPICQKILMLSFLRSVPMARVALVNALIVRNMAQEENVVYIDSRYVAVISGADNRSRTYDLRITNALLYQLSYIGLSGRVTSVTTVGKVKKKRPPRQLPSRLVVVFYSTTSLIQHEKHGHQLIFSFGWVCHHTKQHFFNIGPSYLFFLSNSAILIVILPRSSPANTGR